MPFGFRHPASQVAATAPGMAPPLSLLQNDRGGADISPDLDREQDTELAVASDGDAEVLTLHTLQDDLELRQGDRLLQSDPPGGVGPQDDVAANQALGSDQDRVFGHVDQGLVLANGPGVDLVERKTLEQVVGLGTREGGLLVLPGETAPFVLGPIELLADQGTDLLVRGRAVAEGLEGGDRFEQGLLRLGRETGEDKLVGLEVGYFLGVGHDVFLSVSLVVLKFCYLKACCQALDGDRRPQHPAVPVALGGVDVGHAVVVDAFPHSKPEAGEREDLTSELLFNHRDVVVVDVAVPAGPDELTNRKIGLLGEHVRQEGVGGDIRR